MSIPKHTLGPWVVHDIDTSERGKYREKVFHVITGGDTKDGLHIGGYIHPADVALITAAPELLNALFAIVEEIDRRGLCLDDKPRLCAIDEHLIVNAMAALDKAKGGAA